MPAPWILLVDTLAGAMIFLSLSGVILWWEPPPSTTCKHSDLWRFCGGDGGTCDVTAAVVSRQP
jgi:hypothetical protein